MKKNGGGSIINISIVAGLAGGLSGENIRVYSVHHGLVTTPILEGKNPEFIEEIENSIPLGFATESLDLAYGVLYLASDESCFVTGSELVIDGGHTA